MTLTREDVLEQIRDVLEERREIPRERVTESTEVAALDLDSLEVASILLDWEQDHGVQFEDERVVSIKTIGQAIDALFEAVEATADAGVH